MPDLKDYSIAAAAPEVRDIEIYQLDISGRLTDGETIVSDFTGERAIRCYVLVEGLTPDQHRQLADSFAGMLLRMRSGLE